MDYSAYGTFGYGTYSTYDYGMYSTRMVPYMHDAYETTGVYS